MFPRYMQALPSRVNLINLRVLDATAPD